MDQRITAFRWLVSELRASVRGVKSWQVWDGNQRVAELPALAESTVRLTPVFESESPEASDGMGHPVYRAPVLVTIEHRASGQRLEEAARVWEQIQGTLDTADRDLVLRGRRAGVSWWEWVGGGVTAGDNTSSVGQVRLVIYLTR